MTAKYYRDADGNFIGGFVGDAQPPENSIYVDAPPSDARQIWDGEKWTYPKSLLKIYAEEKRNSVVASGSTWNNRPIATDETAQQKYQAEMVAILSGVRQDGDPWIFPDGPEILTNLEMKAVAVAARQHVLTAFAKEIEIGMYIDAGVIFSRDQVFNWPGWKI